MLSVALIGLLLGIAITDVDSQPPGTCRSAIEQNYKIWDSVWDFSVYAKAEILKEVMGSAAVGIEKRSTGVSCLLLSAYCQYMKDIHPRLYKNMEICLSVTCMH